MTGQTLRISLCGWGLPSTMLAWGRAVLEGLLVALSALTCACYTFMSTAFKFQSLPHSRQALHTLTAETAGSCVRCSLVGDEAMDTEAESMALRTLVAGLTASPLVC